MSPTSFPSSMPTLALSMSPSSFPSSMHTKQITKIVAPDGAADDWFGYSVSASDSVVVVGAPEDDDNGSMNGSAYLFSITGEFQTKLVAPDGAAGDWFGESVSASDSVVVVGAYGDDDNGSMNNGSAYLFST